MSVSTILRAWATISASSCWRLVFSLIQRLGQHACFVAHRLVGRQQQARRDVGAAHAARGVDARGHHEADVVAVDVAAGQPADVDQRAQPDAVRAARQQAQAHLRDDPVLAHQRHDVGQRADGRHLHERRQEIGAVGAGAERLHQLQRHPDSRQVLVRVAAVVALGVHDRQRARQVHVGLVVVGDDQVEAQLARALRGLHPADAAVHGDDEQRAVGVQPLDRRRLQAVAVLQPLGDEVDDVGADELQRPAQDHRRGDPVHVVVAVHGDAFPARDRAEDAVHGGRHVGSANGSCRSSSTGDRKRRAASTSPSPRMHSRRAVTRCDAELVLEHARLLLVAPPGLPDARRHGRLSYLHKAGVSHGPPLAVPGVEPCRGAHARDRRQRLRQRHVEQRRRLLVVRVGAAAWLRHDLVHQSGLDQVGSRQFQRGRGLDLLAGVAPQDRGAALGRDHAVDRELVHQDAITDGDAERAAAAAFPVHDDHDRRVERHHLAQVERNRFRDAPLLRFHARDTPPACR